MCDDAASLSDAVMDETMEDGAWKDTFDNILEPRPKLRQLNLLKPVVRASFNIDSSVENCSSRNESSSSLQILEPTPQPAAIQENFNNLTKNSKKLRHGSISTPVANRLLLDPFKCSLSPIGAWKFRFFDNSDIESKNKRTNNAEKFHATPINPDIVVDDYDAEQQQENAQPSPATTALTAVKELSPLPIPRKLSKGKKRTQSQRRHVCFESVVKELTPSPTPPPQQQQKSIEHSNVSDAVIIEELHQDRPTSLTLQPGKWRKSLCIWRRQQQPMASDNRKSSNLRISTRHHQLSTVDDNSVEFVAVTYLAGRRKSICLKAERQSENRTRPPSNIQYDGDNVWEGRVLQRCNQIEPLPFDQLYGAENMLNCFKIGEGAYGEVFLNSVENKKSNIKSVLKIIPIEGQMEINGEIQKTFEQILPEIIISMELCSLRDSLKCANSTSGFVGVQKVTYIKGKYPQHMIKLWEDYDNNKGSENDHPEVFTDAQIYIVLELEFSGKDLEAFCFNNAEQSYYALQQIILTLAVGEEAFQFEHRDLHWGNILLVHTADKQLKYKLDGKQLTVPTKGVKTTIIDYTLSRMTFNDSCLYNDLSCDEELFTATGDYQFDIYRMMRDALKNNWETYEPRTNIFWISYVTAKMLDGVTYKNTRTKTHTLYIHKIKQLQDTVLQFKSAAELARHIRK